MDVLLIQIRDPRHRMTLHEQECLERRVRGMGVRWRVRNVFAQQPSREWCDGVQAMVLGGSGAYSVHDARSEGWVGPLRDVLEKALADALPSFGVCFGHQLLGYHLGGSIVTDESLAEVGTITVDLNAHGRSDPLFGPLEPCFQVHTGHSDAVLTAPTRVQVLGSSSTLQTQVFKVTGAPFYSTQFHPDITGLEADERYQAYHPTLAPNAAESVPISPFSFGQDEATELLPRFMEAARAQQLQ